MDEIIIECSMIKCKNTVKLEISTDVFHSIELRQPCYGYGRIISKSEAWDLYAEHSDEYNCINITGTCPDCRRKD